MNRLCPKAAAAPPTREAELSLPLIRGQETLLLTPGGAAVVLTHCWGLGVGAGPWSPAAAVAARLFFDLQQRCISSVLQTDVGVHARSSGTENSPLFGRDCVCVCSSVCVCSEVSLGWKRLKTWTGCTLLQLRLPWLSLFPFYPVKKG